ncbi:MAG: response regulator [Chitinivibrionales bacterium]|nr:response regulator [Chitinivibrionales bacterium]
MEKSHILVVDDDSLFRESVVEILERQGYDPVPASNGDEAIRLFMNTPFDLVISDMKMPGMSGIEVLEKVKGINAEVPFCMVTAFGDVATAVDAMKKGANDYIQKTDTIIDEMEFTVKRLLEYHSLIKENRRLKSVLSRRYSYVGKNAAVEEIRKLTDKVAPSRSTVLVSGESGTGKELVARSIHFSSNRCENQFIKVNCAALPEGLIESELFGHEKGAFTGAVKQKTGKFELASGGTILLDEIGEMPATVQVKLLRVLQEKEINRVGGDVPISVDVRVVATTNRDLGSDVGDGRFREDLFYRLNVFHISLPPLRERKDDIPSLVDHFIQKYNDENGFSVDGVGENGIEKLKAWDWPGNIRELENTIERAVVLTRSGLIDSSLFELRQNAFEKQSDAADIRPGLTIASAEKELILRTLEHCDQNRTRAAKMLDISIRTLRNKLKEYAVSAS